jgi:hypothetical protein
MATACWAFIVAKGPPRDPASTLVFSSLQGTNKEIHQQLIHKAVWTAWGQFSTLQLHAEMAGNFPLRRQIIDSGAANLSFK